MYDFDNSVYRRHKNNNYKEMKYVGNFQSHSTATVCKNYLAGFIQVTCHAVFLLVLFSLLFLFFANLPQIFDWLTGIVVGIFEFIFKVVEFLFYFAYMVIFFFLAGIFMK